MERGERKRAAESWSADFATMENHKINLIQTNKFMNKQFGSLFFTFSFFRNEINILLSFAFPFSDILIEKIIAN